MCNPSGVRVASKSKSTETVKSVLPTQDIPGALSAQVVDSKGDVAAIGALVRYSNNQAYFVLQHLDELLGKKAVAVSAPNEEQPWNMRIDEVHDHFPNRSHLPMYIQVHHNPNERLILEHLIDNLAETTLGRQNLELKKNVTIDMFDSDADEDLRDRAGFIVTDRLQFRQLTVAAGEALSILKPASDVAVEKLTDAEIGDLIDFDNTLSAQTRGEYLAYLVKSCKVLVAKPSKPNETVVEDDEDKNKLLIHGYVVMYGERILALYAETPAIADLLFKTVIRVSKALTLTFSAPKSHWQHLESLPSTKQRTIYRRHTRGVPSNVKWDKIFAMNVGMNLF